MPAIRTPIRILAVALVACLCPACVTTPQPTVAAPPELQETEFIYEVIGHLYRWYLDEVDVRAATAAGNETIWVRELRPTLDEGDRSRFGEILLPILGVSASVKKADYAIEELGLDVRGDRFKITGVSRTEAPRRPGRSFHPVSIDREELRRYLFNQRGQVTFPDQDLVERLRTAVRSRIDDHLRDTGKEVPAGDRSVHCAPLSPVANEVWVFWEAGRLLIRFASDLDIEDPAVWTHENLNTDLYDIDEQVVVSLQEVPGSNAYLTRDQVGRALYNCIVLGRRYELPPPAGAPTP